MNRLKKIKTCEKCKAHPSGVGSFCKLGYNLYNNMAVAGKCYPLEPCPKPLTKAEYIESRRKNDR